MAVTSAAGGPQTATREPSASRASMIGSVFGSSPSGRVIWIAARAHRLGRQLRRLQSRHPAASLNEDGPRLVDHQLRPLVVVEGCFEPQAGTRAR